MRFRYRTFAIMLLFLIVLGFPANALAYPEIASKAAVLMDADSGRVLYEENEHSSLPQASTTKITTAILALENGNLQDEITVSKYAAETGGSAIWLETGEILTLEQLIYAMLLPSANDAAAAVAEHIAGSETEFVKMMNAFARQVGALDTHYANPHGLPADGHYSSAYDLALIARYAMKNPQFAKIVATEKKTIPWAGHEWSRLLVNHNKFITNPELYPGVDGVKNGYTKEAGYCLVASAKRNGMRLIAVVLNSPDPSTEVMQLFDYGFENFDRTLLLSGGETVKTISLKNNQQLSLVAAEPFYAALGLKEAGRVIVNVNVPQDVSLPVRKGEVYGKAVYEVDGQVIGMVNLLAARDVEKDTWLSFVWRMFVDAITKFS